MVKSEVGRCHGVELCSLSLREDDDKWLWKPEEEGVGY